MSPEFEMPGGFYMREMDPYEQDFGEDEDIDDQNGWMVVNEGDITQLLNQIQEAELKEDEEEFKKENLSSQLIPQMHENIATEKLTAETLDKGDTDHVLTTDTLASSKLTNFWTAESVIEDTTKNGAANKSAYEEDLADSVITTSTVSITTSTTAATREEGTAPSLNSMETNLSTDENFDGMTPDF
ncbi:unnamed protein product [Hydatigera taeniaeformis]|uniref:PAM2 domain-containing protein n=1 Tax=Hydatigena taeniaeformis TaxID=6205 RepID=A0A0R3X0Y8_HYDTA|nr:unnamed protein product [Hydatigera taeniaeformis]